MQLPPVHSLSETEYFVSGDVIIHETAAIAPGVILEADSGCQIVVGAGVCLGLGTVIIACAGNVQLADGVVLAPGTLVIGPVTIGHSACVGSRSTIFQRDVAAQALVPAGELLMVTRTQPDPGRPSPKPAPVPPSQDNPNNGEIKLIPSPWDSGDASIPPDGNVNAARPGDQPPPEVPLTPTTPDVVPSPPDVSATAPSPGQKAPVVGQVYINQLLLTLFPERKFFQS